MTHNHSSELVDAETDDAETAWLFDEVDRILSDAFDRIIAEFTGEGVAPRRTAASPAIRTATGDRRAGRRRFEPKRPRTADPGMVGANQRGPPRRNEPDPDR